MQLAGPACVVELLLHECVVARTLDGSEHPERDDAVRRVRDARERKRGGEVGLVVRDSRLAGRLPVLQVQTVILLLADEAERAVVVDVAVLEDLHE